MHPRVPASHLGLRPETLVGTLASDAFTRLVDLLKLEQAEGCGVPEGTLLPTGFGIVIVSQRAPMMPAPAAGAAGLQVQANQPYNFGPADPGQCRRIDLMWVRNLTPGSNATVTFDGLLCREA